MQLKVSRISRIVYNASRKYDFKLMYFINALSKTNHNGMMDIAYFSDLVLYHISSMEIARGVYESQL